MNDPTINESATSVDAGFEPLLLHDEFLRHIGDFFTRSDSLRGTLTVGVRTDKQHSNRYGLVHGGYLSTLADVAVGINVDRATNGSGPVTAHLSLDFIGAARAGTWIEAHTTLTKSKGRLLFGECHITAGQLTIARSNAIFFAREKPF